MRHFTRLALLALLALLAALTACAAAPTPLPPGQSPPLSETLDARFHLAFGQTATLDGDRLSVEFAEVVEDSRCPSDVECIQAGSVTVRLHVTLDGADAGDLEFTLQPGPPEPVTATVGDYNIALSDVTPYPVSTQPNVFEDYEAALRISR